MYSACYLLHDANCTSTIQRHDELLTSLGTSCAQLGQFNCNFMLVTYTLDERCALPVLAPLYHRRSTMLIYCKPQVHTRHTYSSQLLACAEFAYQQPPMPLCLLTPQ
jgi:hypothetical protein